MKLNYSVSFKFTAHIASHADVLRGSAGTPDEPVRMSVWEATAHKIRRQKILTLREKKLLVISILNTHICERLFVFH